MLGFMLQKSGLSASSVGHLRPVCDSNCYLTFFNIILLGPSERETLLMELSVQGKKGAKDYADNYCVEFDGVHHITRNLSTCLVSLDSFRVTCDFV